MNSRSRAVIMAAAAFVSLVILALIPLRSMHRGASDAPGSASSDVRASTGSRSSSSGDRAAASPLVEHRIDPDDVTVREAPAPNGATKTAPAARDARDPKQTGSTPATRGTNLPGDDTTKFATQPATEARLDTAPEGRETGAHVVLASVTDPAMRMMMPGSEPRMAIPAPESTPGSSSNSSSSLAPNAPASSSSSAVTAPAPTPTPDFCPVGTSMKASKDAGSKEKFCVKSDRGGVPVKQGPFLAWWKTGKKRYQGTFTNGKQDGEWMEWYSTGVLAARGTYHNGKKDGAWVFYREDGKKAEEGTFKSGEKNGHWVFFEDGHRAGEGEMKPTARFSKEHGKWIYYWPNGVKKEEGSFAEGRRDGRWTEFDQKGHVVSVADYHDGYKD